MKHILKALTLAALLALPLGVLRAQSVNTTNLPSTILASAARTAATVNSTDQTNVYWRGLALVINVSAFTTGTYTFTIQGKDQVSGSYYPMLTSAAIGAVTTTPVVLRVYPGMTPIANQANGDVLPRVWRVQAIGAATPNMTFSVSAVLFN
jgi:hypothetical protein